jgi:glutathione S-transferase
MKLYHAPSSPSSRSVLMTIKCLNLDVEIQHIDLLRGENRAPEFLKVNPSGQVPTLVDGDLILNESRAIMAYLINSKNPGNSLYPSDVRRRAICDSRMYFDATGFFVHLLAALVFIFIGMAQ